ncbi:hypothetical protein [Moorena producens]|uniref:hypothetical protein n=1 Tax=Moorena producens TaxID=1155739 RepID=UPI003C73DAA2
MGRWGDGEMGRWGDGEIFIKRCSAVLGSQCGLGEPVRSWGASAVLGVSPMSNWRGFPHEQLAWFPP